MTGAVDGNDPADSHIGELELRRFRAGEIAAERSQTIGGHTTHCGRCRAKLVALEDEQRGFERAIPFERFAGGVERAAREPRRRAGRSGRVLWLVPVLSVAAAASFFLLPRPHPRPLGDASGFNQTKGGALDAMVRIATADGRHQRALTDGGRDQLAHGDRLRIGYLTDRARHVIVLSIDDGGEITTLYRETSGGLTGASLRVVAGKAMAYLPDSVELTGHGHERLFMFVADGPFSVDSAITAVRASRTAAGPAGVEGMTAATAAQALDALSPRVFTWLLDKP
jgi:hypothetical protein